MGDSSSRTEAAVAARLALALVCLVFASACGSDSPSPSPSPTAASAAVPVAPATAEAVESVVTPTVTPTVVPTTTPAPVPTEVTVAEALRARVNYGAELDQFGWLQFPATAPGADGFPVVVLIHGGFWRQQFDASLMDALANDLAERGFASWNIEYRRVDGAGGWPLTGDDVAAAIEYLAAIADEPLDLDRVVSVGHSAGGHLGLWALGQQDRMQLRGSVGLGAVVDLAYFPQAVGLLGGTADQVPEVYIDAAPVLDPDRVVLIQGSNDFIVPADSLQVAADALVPIVTVDGDDHFDLIDPASASWAATIEAIERFVTLSG